MGRVGGRSPAPREGSSHLAANNHHHVWLTCQETHGPRTASAMLGCKKPWAAGAPEAQADSSWQTGRPFPPSAPRPLPRLREGACGHRAHGRTGTGTASELQEPLQVKTGCVWKPLRGTATNEGSTGLDTEQHFAAMLFQSRDSVTA